MPNALADIREGWPPTPNLDKLLSPHIGTPAVARPNYLASTDVSALVCGVHLQMNGNDLTKAIVIVRAAMTSSAKKFLNEMPADSVQVQAFEEAELMVNITEHEVPANKTTYNNSNAVRACV